MKTSRALQAQGNGSYVLKCILFKQKNVTQLTSRSEMSLVIGGPQRLAYMICLFELLCLVPHWTVTVDNSELMPAMQQPLSDSFPLISPSLLVLVNQSMDPSRCNTAPA